MKHLKPLNESSESYRTEVKLDLNYHGSSFKGREINTISSNPVNVTFDIDIDSREWGIKGISIFNIRGPKQIELEVEYYEDDLEDDFQELSETFIIDLDWSKLKEEVEKGTGILTINEISITLTNDPEGGLVVSKNEIRNSGSLIVSELIANISSL